jgi:hypothetical protein
VGQPREQAYRLAMVAVAVVVVVVTVVRVVVMVVLMIVLAWRVLLLVRHSGDRPMASGRGARAAPVCQGRGHASGRDRYLPDQGLLPG